MHALCVSFFLIFGEYLYLTQGYSLCPLTFSRAWTSLRLFIHRLIHYKNLPIFKCIFRVKIEAWTPLDEWKKSGFRVKREWRSRNKYYIWFRIHKEMISSWTGSLVLNPHLTKTCDPLLHGRCSTMFHIYFNCLKKIKQEPGNCRGRHPGLPWLY